MLGWQREDLAEVELRPVPTQMGSVGDVWPGGGVGPCPSLSEGGESAG